jgi:hypothetical protein
MSFAGEMVCKRRAEESRGSGDEKIHRLRLYRVIFDILR